MPDATPPTAAILGRVSRDKSREARSVTEQQDDNRKACGANGWTVPPGGEYQDIGSASRFATRTRDDWQRLLNDVDAGQYGVVVMWEPSRGSREPEDWFGFLRRCRDSKTLIHVTSAGATYDMAKPRDWRTLADDGVDSAYESEKTSQRVRRNVAASAAAGRPHGLVQYGYERIYDGKTRALTAQQAVQPQAGIAAEIITRIAGREPLSAIRDDLNARGVPAPAGGTWTPATIRRITRCPVYIGKRPNGGKRQNNGRYVGAELVPAIWPAIVAEDIWREAQQVLNDPARATTRPGRYRWLLSYYATCGSCGSLLSAHYARRKTTARTALYECSGPHHCLGVVAAAADRQVAARVIAYLSRPDIYPRLARDTSTEAAIARAEAARLRAELDEWAQADITPRAYQIRDRKLLPQIEAAENRVRRLTVPLPLREMIAPEADIGARWEAMPVAARRDVLTALGFRVEVVKAATAGGRRLSADERIRVRVGPRTGRG